MVRGLSEAYVMIGSPYTILYFRTGRRKFIFMWKKLQDCMYSLRRNIPTTKSPVLVLFLMPIQAALKFDGPIVSAILF